MAQAPWNPWPGLPYDSNSYVHRAGRTARAGRPGKVVSLMSEFDVPRVEEIEKRIGKQLQLLETKDLCNAMVNHILTIINYH